MGLILAPLDKEMSKERVKLGSSLGHDKNALTVATLTSLRQSPESSRREDGISCQG